MKRIVLKGDPKSTQHLYRPSPRGGMYMTGNAKALKLDYGWQAKSQWKGEPLQGPIEVTIALYFKDHRRRDWDNWQKISMDALQGIVFNDDSQIRFAHVEMYSGAVEPCIELNFEEV